MSEKCEHTEMYAYECHACFENMRERCASLETSLDLQRQEFEKLNIEQANRIVELEKANRKMKEALEMCRKVLPRNSALPKTQTLVGDVIKAVEEALAEERP